VTTPKLPPPPRSPQKSSGFSSPLALTIRPSAVTTSAAIRLSQARPYERESQPTPPPRVRPAIPVVEIAPPRQARPWRWVSTSYFSPDGPASGESGPLLAIDRHSVHGSELDHDAVVAGRVAGDVVPSAPDGQDEDVSSQAALVLGPVLLDFRASMDVSRRRDHE